MKITFEYVCNSVAKSLREYGYPDTSAAMIADVFEAMKAGKQDAELPHGIIGRFAESQLRDVWSSIKHLKATP